MEHQLPEILLTQVAHLNYIDLRNYCATSNSLAYLCCNDSLKKILAFKGVIVHGNVEQALKDLYNALLTPVKAYYPEHLLPIYIHHKLFYDEMVRKLSKKWISYLQDKIMDYLLYNEEITNIKFSNDILSIPFKSHLNKEVTLQGRAYEENVIIIPQSVINYILPIINQFKFKNQDVINEYTSTIDADHKTLSDDEYEEMETILGKILDYLEDNIIILLKILFFID